jgi:outer membrane protein TolC
MVSVPPSLVRKEVFVRHLITVVSVATNVATICWTSASPAAPNDRASNRTATCAALADAIARSHPMLRAAQSRSNAAVERSHAESSLPPPMASFEIWDFPIGDPSRADSEGMYMFGLGQEFPGGGRSERARAEEQISQEARAEGADAARRLKADAAHACVSWAVAETVRARLLEHRRLLEQVRDAALVSYRGSAGGLGAVARADAELAGADRRIAESDAELETARTTLAALAGPELALPTSAPALSERDETPNATKLTQIALATRGDIAAAQARKGAASARADAASSEATTPSFEVKATYMQTPGMRAGLGAMLGMSLPWLWGGGNGRRDGARHDFEAAAAEAESARRMARAEVAQAVGRVRALRRSLAVLREREIPAAERAVEAGRASLGSGGFDLSEWLEAASVLRAARVDEARTNGEIEHAFVDLEASVGRPLGSEGAQRGSKKP